MVLVAETERLIERIERWHAKTRRREARKRLGLEYGQGSRVTCVGLRNTARFGAKRRIGKDEGKKRRRGLKNRLDKFLEEGETDSQIPSWKSK